MVPLAKRAGAAVVIVNGGPTDLDHLADAVVGGSISDVLPALCEGNHQVGEIPT
jgi:NAD-dependent SIR2 family protein deacetylase